MEKYAPNKTFCRDPCIFARSIARCSTTQQACREALVKIFLEVGIRHMLDLKYHDGPAHGPEFEIISNIVF